MSRGCWTCRDRKVRCDLRLPTCSKCSQAQRQCLGYGLRLAWPRKGNKRRTIVYAPSSIKKDQAGSRLFKQLLLVNVSYNDIRLSYELSGSGTIREFSKSQLPAWNTTWILEDGATQFSIRPPPMPKSVSLDLIDEQGATPLDYYIKSGSKLFTSLQGDILAPLVLKIAMSDTTSSSKAVLHSILALSCLHLHRHAEASAYRASAISLLSSSLNAGSETKVAFENIATSLLLCMFEVYNLSETYVNWSLYLCGVKQIVLDGLAHRTIDDRECIALKDWIYFYEVLARFGLVHWLERPEKYPLCYRSPTSNLIRITPDQSSQDDVCAMAYSRKVFDSISAFSDILLFSRTSRLSPLEQQRQGNEIELRLRALKRDTVFQDHDLPVDRQSNATMIVHLYLLAALIYLNRTVMKYSGDELQHSMLVEEALLYLGQVQVSEAPWPYFIIGCEAQDDAQRRQILQLPLAGQNKEYSENAAWMQRLVEACWNQDDLDTEHCLSYVDRLSAVISAAPFLPAFV